LIDKRKSHKRRSNTGYRRSGSFRPQSNQKSFVKPKGSISKVFEKYISLAQDASSNGDRISAESYYQHAEHYRRLINEAGGSDTKNGPNSNGHDKSMKEKPSRTERAINAKNEKENINQQNDPHISNSQENKKKKITEDGLEALRPFELSISEEKK